MRRAQGHALLPWLPAATRWRAVHIVVADALRPGSGGSTSPLHRTVLWPRYTPPIATPNTSPVDSLCAHGTTACSTIASASCCASASFVRRRLLCRITELRRLAGSAMWTAAWSMPRCSRHYVHEYVALTTTTVPSHAMLEPPRSSLTLWPAGPPSFNSP